MGQYRLTRSVPSDVSGGPPIPAGEVVVPLFPVTSRDSGETLICVQTLDGRKKAVVSGADLVRL